jgi:hypothetical protein
MATLAALSPGDVRVLMGRQSGVKLQSSYSIVKHTYSRAPRAGDVRENHRSFGCRTCHHRFCSASPLPTSRTATSDTSMSPQPASEPSTLPVDEQLSRAFSLSMAQTSKEALNTVQLFSVALCRSLGAVLASDVGRKARVCYNCPSHPGLWG